MSALTNKCPNCGAALAFNPKTQTLDCEYCASHFSKIEIELLNKKQESKFADDALPKEETNEQIVEKEDEQEDTALYSCPNCGVRIVTTETTAATYCYYCHSPVVLLERLKGTFKPDAVIPFTIDKQQAIQSFLGWTKKKRFIAEDFTSQKQIENITGVYFPYWDVDAKYHGMITGEGINIRIWRVGDIEYTERQYYNVLREGTTEFLEIFKKALNSTQMELTEGILPYDLSKSESFSSAYLAGFQAEKRNIEARDYQIEIHKDLTALSNTMLYQSVNEYSQFTKKQITIEEEKTNWKYTLMPIWLITYKSKKDIPYYFAMNGQTGKINGTLPIDKKKILNYSLIFALGFFVLAILSVFFGGTSS